MDMKASHVRRNVQLATLAKTALSRVTVPTVLVATIEMDAVCVSQDGEENAAIKHVLLVSMDQTVNRLVPVRRGNHVTSELGNAIVLPDTQVLLVPTFVNWVHLAWIVLRYVTAVVTACVILLPEVAYVNLVELVSIAQKVVLMVDLE